MTNTERSLVLGGGLVVALAWWLVGGTMRTGNASKAPATATTATTATSDGPAQLAAGRAGSSAPTRDTEMTSASSAGTRALAGDRAELASAGAGIAATGAAAPPPFKAQMRAALATIEPAVAECARRARASGTRQTGTAMLYFIAGRSRDEAAAVEGTGGVPGRGRDEAAAVEVIGGVPGRGRDEADAGSVPGRGREEAGAIEGTGGVPSRGRDEAVVEMTGVVDDESTVTDDSLLACLHVLARPLAVEIPEPSDFVLANWRVELRDGEVIAIHSSDYSFRKSADGPFD